MFFKKQKPTGDVAILVNDKEIRELDVYDETEESIKAGGLILPKADAEVRYFPEGGKAYIYGYTPDYLAESENIAKLEKSVVLKNIFDYGVTNNNLQFYIMLGALILTIFLLRG